MTALIRSELLKVRTTRGWYAYLGVIVLLYISPVKHWIQQSATADHQQQRLDELQQENRKLEPYRMDFRPIDTVKMAEACGVEALRTSNPDQLASAVKRLSRFTSQIWMEYSV